MKIAIFSDTFFPQVNGVANVAYQSAKTMAKRGHQVKVFTVGARNKRLPPENCENGLEMVYVPSMPAMIYPGERLAMPGSIPAFSKLKSFGPDIIHSHTPMLVGWASIIGARITKAPLVGTHHTFYDHYLKHIKADYDWAKKYSWKYTVAYYNRCDAVISPTKSLADELIKNGLKKPVVILPNPIDTDYFKPPKSGAVKQELKKLHSIGGKSFTYMGRLSYEKSIDQTIRAFALVCKNKPDCRLTIIGDGPEKENLRELAGDLSINDKVKFTGFLRGEHLVKALQANDIFVTASKSENMPLSVLESMATGLPIIAVGERGLVEIVNHGGNGYVVRANDIENLAGKMLALICDDKLLRDFSARSRELALNHSEEKIAGSLENVYKNVLAKRTKS